MKIASVVRQILRISTITAKTGPITVATSLHGLATCRDAFLFGDCVADPPLRHEITIEKFRSDRHPLATGTPLR